MNIKNNLKYFKTSDRFRQAGIILLGAGMASLILGFIGLGFGFIFYILMSVCLPVGFIMYLVGSSWRSSDEDIDTQLKEATDGLEVDFDKNLRYSKRVLKNQQPNTLSGYNYRDGLLFTKSKLGEVRSSEYTKAIVYILSDELYINQRTVSLVSDNVENKVVEIPYTSIKKIEIVSENKEFVFGKKHFSVVDYQLLITYEEELKILLPIKNDIESDNYIIKLKRMVEDYKSQNS